MSLNGGDMIELAQDYKNGDTKIEYRNIWEYCGDGRYENKINYGKNDLLSWTREET